MFHFYICYVLVYILSVQNGLFTDPDKRQENIAICMT